MTDTPRTFEEWWIYPIPVSFDEQDAFRAARRAWHARDPEMAEKDRRLAELEGIDQACDAANKHVILLQARITELEHERQGE